MPYTFYVTKRDYQSGKVFERHELSMAEFNTIIWPDGLTTLAHNPMINQVTISAPGVELTVTKITPDE
jgi:hypothetical protein